MQAKELGQKISLCIKNVCMPDMSWLLFMFWQNEHRRLPSNIVTWEKSEKEALYNTNSHYLQSCASNRHLTHHLAEHPVRNKNGNECRFICKCSPPVVRRLKNFPCCNSDHLKVTSYWKWVLHKISKTYTKRT